MTITNKITDMFYNNLFVNFFFFFNLNEIWGFDTSTEREGGRGGERSALTGESDLC